MKNKVSIKKLVLTLENYVQLISIVFKQIFIKSNAAYFYCELATNLFKLNYLSRAVNYFLKSEENNFNKNIELSTFNWAHLAFAYFDLGDYKKSKYYLEKIYYYDSTDAELIFILAQCNEFLGLYDIALNNYYKVFQIDKENFWDPFSAIFMALDCNMESELTKLFKVLKDRSKTLIQNNISDAIAFILKKNLKDALKLLEKSLFLSGLKENEKYTDNKPMIIPLYHKVLREYKNKDYSLDLFEKEYLLNKKDTYLNYLLAKEYCDRNINLYTALKMINFSMRKGRLNAQYYNLKALILFKLAKYKVAEKVIKKNLLNHPDDIDSKELLIKISKQLNRF